MFVKECHTLIFCEKEKNVRESPSHLTAGGSWPTTRPPLKGETMFKVKTMFTWRVCRTHPYTTIQLILMERHYSTL